MKPFARLVLLGVSVLGLALISTVPLGASEETAQHLQPRRGSSGAICPHCNIVLISLDTLRADALPCYGYHRDTAPHLCAYAKRHILFTQSFSNAPYTLASHMSIFTSRYPSWHRVIDAFRGDRLPEDMVTLPEALQAHGYQTVWAAVTVNEQLLLEHGFGRGIGLTKGVVPVTEWAETYRRLRQEYAGQPIFVFFHNSAPHAPYLPPLARSQRITTAASPPLPLTRDDYEAFTSELRSDVLRDFEERLRAAEDHESQRYLQEFSTALKQAATLDEAEEIFNQLDRGERQGLWRTRYFKLIDPSDPGHIAYLRALYDEEIAAVEARMGELLAMLSTPPYAEDTIVLFTSDHGEEFMEHGALEHGRNLYHTSTFVPLILGVPGLEARQVDAPVQSIDIAPTLLGLVGIEVPSTFQGIDLTGLLRGDPAAARNAYLLSEHSGRKVRTIRNHRWKLHVYQDPPYVELYNLQTDFGEQWDVAAEHPWLVQRLRGTLQELLDRRPAAPPLERDFPDWIDPIKQQQLIDEGYF